MHVLSMNLNASSLSRRAGAALLLLALALLGACGTAPPGYDYTAFRNNRPASLLVLPPVNESPDIKATYGVLAQATLPLAEAGYYVLPVSLVDETFRQNGLTTPTDIHAVPAAKLREIFGADAAVYLTVKSYGTSYLIISSDTVVRVEGRIVDLRSGQLLWQGSASASSSENEGSKEGGLVGLLLRAVVSQVINTATDASYKYAGTASQRLLGAPREDGVLFGPRSPRYQKD
jgi:hypothetical protein